MTIAPITASLSVISSLGRYIITDSKSETDNYYSKDYIHMNACVSESGCVWINSTWQHLSTRSEAVGFSY